MTKWPVKTNRWLGRLARLALAPVVQGADEILVGGQAVIEGVMMRSPHSFAVAVRRPGGAISLLEEYIDKPSEKHTWLKLPLLRGLGTLGQALVLGIRALRYSAEASLQDPKEASEQAATPARLSNWVLAVNLALSLGFFIFFYKFLPLLLATEVKARVPAAQNLIVFNLVDGLIRIALFIGFLAALARLKDVKRLFEYHGAEHKTVWAFEKEGRIDLETARASMRFHPRCGTSFLLVVMGIAMVLYLFLPFQSFAGKLIARLLLLPVIAGVSYEFIRFAAKSQGRLWRWASQPGLWLQRITTREPDDAQLETAIRALRRAMELEKARGGELVVA